MKENSFFIVVILGTAHLISTPGKLSPDGRLREYKYSRELVSEIKAKLEAYGYTVFVDYESPEPLQEWTAARKRLGYSKGEQAMELDYRAEQVNAICRKYGKEHCLYVSIHVNGSGDDDKWHGAGGWAAFTTLGRTKADALAECLYDSAFSNLKEYIDIIDDGKRRGDYTEKQVPFRMDNTDGDRDLEANLAVLRKTACPAVLTENLFQDNKRDVDFLLSDEGRHAIERLHVEGIIKYIESL